MRVFVKSGALTITRPLRVRDLHLYFLCESVTGTLVCFMVVFAPWAFGTTEPWSIWTMNACGYGLGLLLGIKLIIRWRTGYAAAAWQTEELGRSRNDAAAAYDNASSVLARHPPQMMLAFIGSTPIMAFATLSILAYCLVAAANARATFNPVSLAFDYHDYFPWLPHSFDSQSTWKAFWIYLGLACWFWALRDWLPIRSSTDLYPGKLSHRAINSGSLLPRRLRRLLWVLALSGGLLGLAGIAQRVSNTPKLLFLVKPEIHGNAQEQFASYAYRGNAGQYFNLLWPVCLGFWWIIHRSNHVKSVPKILLLACIIIMAACPLISSARGAALTDMALLPAVTIALLFAGLRRKHRRLNSIMTPSTALVLVFLVSASTLGFGLGWKQLRPRLDEFSSGMQERMQLHERAQLIARDYPAFGTGPGTFVRVFQFYRSGPDAYWPAQLHNDWLETRVTFGWIGSGFIALAFITTTLPWFRSDRVRVRWPLVVMIWLSLSGCLLQARWDFPLQVYSILFLFVAWCSVLSILTTKHSPTST